MADTAVVLMEGMVNLSRSGRLGLWMRCFLLGRSEVADVIWVVLVDDSALLYSSLLLFLLCSLDLVIFLELLAFGRGIPSKTRPTVSVTLHDMNPKRLSHTLEVKSMTRIGVAILQNLLPGSLSIFR